MRSDRSVPHRKCLRSSAPASTRRCRFKLTPVTHAILLEEIERFRAGERVPSDPAHAHIVEDLSGWRYDQLWGDNSVARRR